MSTIIKSGRASTGPAAFNFADMADQARIDAMAIVSAAEQAAEEIRTRAEQEGRQAAQIAAEKMLDDKVAARTETVLPALRKAAEDLGQARQAWRAHWEKQAVHLAAAMARRIARRELVRQPEITLGLVAEALELAAGRPDIRILLNPDDYRALGDQVDRLAAEASRAAPAEVVADPSIGRGGCRVETRHGTIDETFEAQLDRIEQELL